MLPRWSTATPCGWLSPPSVHPASGERGVPSAEYWDIASPPKLPNHAVASGAMAAPHAPPFMPPPSIGLPRVGCPTGSRTVMYWLGSLVPGSQLLLDQTLPLAS